MIRFDISICKINTFFSDKTNFYIILAVKITHKLMSYFVDRELIINIE